MLASKIEKIDQATAAGESSSISSGAVYNELTLAPDSGAKREALLNQLARALAHSITVDARQTAIKRYGKLDNDAWDEVIAKATSITQSGPLPVIHLKVECPAQVNIRDEGRPLRLAEALLSQVLTGLKGTQYDGRSAELLRDLGANNIVDRTDLVCQELQYERSPQPVLKSRASFGWNLNSLIDYVSADTNMQIGPFFNCRPVPVVEISGIEHYRKSAVVAATESVGNAECGFGMAYQAAFATNFAFEIANGVRSFHSQHGSLQYAVALPGWTLDLLRVQFTNQRWNPSFIREESVISEIGSWNTIEL